MRPYGSHGNSAYLGIQRSTWVRRAVPVNARFTQSFDSSKLPPFLPIGIEGSSSAPVTGAQNTVTLASVITNQTGEVEGTARLGQSTVTLAGVVTNQAGTVTGYATAHGSSAVTLADVGITAAGRALISGNSNVSLDSVASTQAGTVTALGNYSSVQLAGVIVNQTGTVRGNFSNVQLADVVSVGRGTVATITHGTSAVTLAGVICSASGTVRNNRGVQNVTLNDVVSTSVGHAYALGASSVMLADVVSSATGKVMISGSSVITLDGVSIYQRGGAPIDVLDTLNPIYARLAANRLTVFNRTPSLHVWSDR